MCIQHLETGIQICRMAIQMNLPVNPTVLFIRDRKIVNVATAADCDKETGYVGAALGTFGYAPDALAFLCDSVMATTPINPVTKEPWEPGEKHRLLQTDGGLGVVHECILGTYADKRGARVGMVVQYDRNPLRFEKPDIMNGSIVQGGIIETLEEILMGKDPLLHVSEAGPIREAFDDIPTGLPGTPQEVRNLLTGILLQSQGFMLAREAISPELIRTFEAMANPHVPAGRWN